MITETTTKNTLDKIEEVKQAVSEALDNTKCKYVFITYQKYTKHWEVEVKFNAEDRDVQPA